MIEPCGRNKLASTRPIFALAAIFALLVSSSLSRAADDAQALASPHGQRLTEFVEAYTYLYFALGVCDGFVEPRQEAAFDPYGPMLQNWPDSFKRQMSETREEGRIEGRNVSRQLGLTRQERIELCSRQIDAANADVQRLIARYRE